MPTTHNALCNPILKPKILSAHATPMHTQPNLIANANTDNTSHHSIITPLLPILPLRSHPLNLFNYSVTTHSQNNKTTNKQTNGKTKSTF
jgi:hypothetical protein